MVEPVGFGWDCILLPFHDLCSIKKNEKVHFVNLIFFFLNWKKKFRIVFYFFFFIVGLRNVCYTMHHMISNYGFYVSSILPFLWWIVKIFLTKTKGKISVIVKLIQTFRIWLETRGPSKMFKAIKSFNYICIVYIFLNKDNRIFFFRQRKPSLLRISIKFSRD